MRADIEQKSIDILQKCVPCGAAAAALYAHSWSHFIIIICIFALAAAGPFVRPPYLYMYRI